MTDDPVPVLRTERLVMRGFRHRDVDAYAEIVGDPEVVRFLGPPLDREQAWRGLAVHAGHWVLRGFGSWALERRSDGALLGRVGLWYPEGWPGIELGWMLARHAWGQGYASEAARAAMNWTWPALALPRLISLIRPENRASAAVAQRVGMTPVADDEIHGQTVVVHAVDAPAGGPPGPVVVDPPKA